MRETIKSALIASRFQWLGWIRKALSHRFAGFVSRQATLGDGQIDVQFSISPIRYQAFLQLANISSTASNCSHENSERPK